MALTDVQIRRRELKNAQSRFKKRKDRLCQRANTFGCIFLVQVFVLVRSVRHDGQKQFFEYCNHPEWPPSHAQWVCPRF